MRRARTLGAIVALACGLGGRTAVAEEPRPVRLMAYNVLYDSTDDAASLALIRDVGPAARVPHTISETSARWYSGGGPVQSQNVVQNAQGGDPTLGGNMAPGMINVTASVQVVFELE
jgi:hypothetical protein